MRGCMVTSFLGGASSAPTRFAQTIGSRSARRRTAAAINSAAPPRRRVASLRQGADRREWRLLSVDRPEFRDGLRLVRRVGRQSVLVQRRTGACFGFQSILHRASIVEALPPVAFPPIARPPRTSTPLPGRTVRGSTQGRPIMAALDLLGRRWTLRVLWELRDGPLGFRAIQAACDDMSSSVLRDRLHELTE